MFNQLKNGWGLREAWQQRKLTLLRWVHVRQTAFALMQLLALSHAAEVRTVKNHDSRVKF